MILEYKLERFADRSQGEMYTPGWVSNGGHLQDPDDFTLMGFAPSVRPYKIPDSIKTMTLAEAQSRAVGIHGRYPFRKVVPSTAGLGDVMTQQEVEDMVAAIVTAYDLP